ncbi:unnamed protein product [Rhodiola kirilowii]
MGKRRKRSSKTCRIDQLPDDLLIHILSFIDNLAEISLTAILSSRWRNLWRYNTCLDFSATTFLPDEDMLATSHASSYISWVNKFIETRAAIPELPSVKQLRIQYGLKKKHKRHIDQWIDFAIANRVQTLRLEFAPYLGRIYPPGLYKLSEESWYRTPSGLSSLKCLKSLFLLCVNVSKQFIEFILSSCPFLEDLTLHYAGTYTDLDVSGVPPLRLKRLKIDVAEPFALTKLCAPHLTSFSYESPWFNPQTIDVPVLTDLTIGCRYGQGQHIMKYLDHFWTYLPQLEKLDLMMGGEPRRFKLKQLPKLVKLKYLKMSYCGDTDPIFYRIVNFINSCPLLETFSFQIFDGEMFHRRPMSIKRQSRIQEWRKGEESYSFKFLKVLELFGTNGKIIDQEVVKCIISKTPNLEEFIINTHTHYMLEPSTPEIMEAVKSKARKLCQRSRLEANITLY